MSADLDARREVARAWQAAAAAEFADHDHLVPDICDGCALPATTTDGSEDRVPLCDACARVCEQEWIQGARSLFFRVLEAAGHPNAGIPLFDDIRKLLGQDEP